jgi:hypothetical protein
MLLLFWDGLSGGDQVFQIKRDRLLSVSDALIDGFALGDTSRKCRHAHGVIAFWIRVDNYRVGAHIGPNLQQTPKLLGVDSCLIEDG